MQHNNMKPPPSNAISIQDIASLYIALANIPNRTENLTKILTNLENVLVSFSTSLSMLGAH